MSKMDFDKPSKEFFFTAFCCDSEKTDAWVRINMKAYCTATSVWPLLCSGLVVRKKYYTIIENIVAGYFNSEISILAGSMKQNNICLFQLFATRKISLICCFICIFIRFSSLGAKTMYLFTCQNFYIRSALCKDNWAMYFKEMLLWFFSSLPFISSLFILSGEKWGKIIKLTYCKNSLGTLFTKEIRSWLSSGTECHLEEKNRWRFIDVSFTFFSGRWTLNNSSRFISTELNSKTTKLGEI